MPNPLNVAVRNAQVGHMPAVASDGKGYLVVSDSNGTVSGLWLDPHGAALGPPLAICDPAHGSGSEAAVVCVRDGGAYYVVWMDAARRIRGTLVAAGQPLAPTDGTVLDGSTPSNPHSNHTPAACFGRGMAFVAWETERQDVGGVHVDAGGKVLDPTPLQMQLGGPKPPPPGRLSVAALDAELFLVARDAILSHTVIATVLVKGANVSPGPFAPVGPVPPYVGQFNAAACSGWSRARKPSPKCKALLVWTSGSTGPGWLAGLRGARVDGSGKLLDANGFDIHSTGGDIPAIACDGNRYLVAWQKGSDIQAICVDPNGNVAPTGGTQVCSATSSRLAAASNGNNFLVVWETGWAVVS